MTRAPLLELVNVSKSFGNTRALDAVSFDLAPGEVHVLAGENGAGKSTLIGVLSGVHTAYQGELRVGGRLVRFRSPAHALGAGIATIHQELSLVPNLSVLDNLMLPTRRAAFSWVRRDPERSRARNIVSLLGYEVDLDAPVESLPLSDRQLLEIARALALEAKVFVLDEPTSALSAPEVQRLFEKLEKLRAEGAGILYISHRLEEIYRLADRISVLRDGRCLFTRRRSELSPEELVRAMVGKELARERPRRAERPVAAPRLCVQNLTVPGNPALSGISFDLSAGEILGVAGQRGSGAARMLHALYGDAGSIRGTIELNGRVHVPRSPGASIERGIVLLASDRKLSVFGELTVPENATLSSVRRFSGGLLVSREREHRAVRDRAPELSLKASSFFWPAGFLSGGNQQKLALLRCLLAEPKVLLLDDPTRGIDVGARAEVYTALERIAERGVAVLFYSSDLDELCELADRVLVLYQGRLTSVLEGEALTRERLLRPLMGGTS